MKIHWIYGKFVYYTDSLLDYTLSKVEIIKV